MKFGMSCEIMVRLRGALVRRNAGQVRRLNGAVANVVDIARLGGCRSNFGKSESAGNARL
jgi:hypothetical protein